MITQPCLLCCCLEEGGFWENQYEDRAYYRADGQDHMEFRRHGSLFNKCVDTHLFMVDM